MVRTTRRNLLKSIGAMGIATVGLAALSNPVAADQPQKSWSISNKRPLDDDYPDGRQVCQGTSFNWYSARWDTGREAYVHDMSFQTNTTTDSEHYCADQGYDCNGNITSTWWDLWLENPPSSEYRIVPFINDNYSHVYPASDYSDPVPTWVEIPVDVAVGAVNVYAGVAMVIDDVVQALVDNDASVSERSGGGWQMDYGFGGKEARGHSQRFQVEMPAWWQDSDDHLHIHTGGSSQHEKNACDVELGINFEKGCMDCDPWLVEVGKGTNEGTTTYSSTSGTYSSSSETTSSTTKPSLPEKLGHPEDLKPEVRNRLGLHKLPPKQAKGYWANKPKSTRPDKIESLWVSYDWPIGVRRLE